MSKNEKVFQGVASKVIDVFKEELGANCSLGEDGVTYTIKETGFLATAVFDEASSSLDVKVLGKPWLIPIEVVWMKIEDAIKQAETPVVKEVQTSPDLGSKSETPKGEEENEDDETKGEIS